MLPALLALVWYWPSLWHGFRSDDFLTVYYYDRDAGGVKWGRVVEEWVRPWFGVRDLYRPFVSLSFGANWALSTTPFGFHLVNVLLLAGTATFVAAAASRLAVARPRLAGLVAGALVVLHPAAVEPTAWIAARTTGLQVFWSAVAYWSFLRWRDGDGGRWLPLLATALACASKEGAVLLPASLVALDLLRGRLPGWRVHLPFFGLVGGYLLFRWCLLGVFTTAEEGHTVGERLNGALALLRQLAMPPAGGAAGSLWMLVPCAALGMAALAGARAALWCLPWAALLMLPGTTHVQLSANELAGRFVFDAVPALALFAAVVVGGQHARALLATASLAALGALVLFASGSLVHLRVYGEQDRVIAKLQQELLAAAKDAGPGKPFGVVGLPKLPLLQPALWGFLTQRPFARQDLPVVGLENMLTRDPGAPLVFANTTAVHALVANGAGCAVWNGATNSLVPMGKAASDVVDFVRDPADARRFVPPRLLPPTAVGALEIVSSGPVASWRLQVLGNLEGPYAKAAFTAAPVPATAVWWLDLTGVLPWFVAATVGGGPAGVELTGDGQALPAGSVVRAHAVLPTLSLPGEVPAVVRREELVRWLVPSQPARAAVLYLLLPTGLFAVASASGSALALDPATRSQLDFVCDVLGPCRVHWFWQAEGGSAGPAQRSGFGTCIVR